MGIVFSHTVAAGLYYFRNGRSLVLDQPLDRNDQHQYATSNQNKHGLFDISGDTNEERCGGLQEEDLHLSVFNEALMPVLDANSLTELREAIKLAISRCVLNAQLIKVFLRDPLTSHLVDEHCRPLPNSRFISDILHTKGKTVVSVNHNQDSIRELLGAQHSNDSNHSVLLLPIPERGTQKSIGLVVVVSQAGSLSSVDPKRVEFCLKQISITYEVVKNNLSRDSGSPHISNLLSLIQLCGELNDPDAAKLEIKVVRYLQQKTDAESGFLLLVVPETQMLFCQAVGDTVLQEEVRFAGPTSCFAKALETKQPITLADIPVERRHEVEKIIRRQINSLLCVPVCVTDSKDLLALACMVNKCNHEQFNQDDIDTILECFKYTATVLTSTLAFQNERKLKNQTQALLLVARKLFTRLDTLSDQSPSGNNSPGKVNFVSPEPCRCGNRISDVPSTSQRQLKGEGIGLHSYCSVESASFSDFLKTLSQSQTEKTLVLLPLSAFRDTRQISTERDFVSFHDLRSDSESSSEYSTATSSPPDSPVTLLNYDIRDTKLQKTAKASKGSVPMQSKKSPQRQRAGTEPKCKDCVLTDIRATMEGSSCEQEREMEFIKYFFNNLEHFGHLLSAVHEDAVSPMFGACKDLIKDIYIDMNKDQSLTDLQSWEESHFNQSGIPSAQSTNDESTIAQALNIYSSCPSAFSPASRRTSPMDKKSLISPVNKNWRKTKPLQISNMEIFAHTSREGFEAGVSCRKRPRNAAVSRQTRSVSSCIRKANKPSPVARKTVMEVVDIKADSIFHIVRPSVLCGADTTSEESSFLSLSEDEAEKEDSSIQKLLKMQEAKGENQLQLSYIKSGFGGNKPQHKTSIISTLQVDCQAAPGFLKPVHDNVSDQASSGSENLENYSSNVEHVVVSAQDKNPEEELVIGQVPGRATSEDCYKVISSSDVLGGEGDNVKGALDTDLPLPNFHLTHTEQGDLAESLASCNKHETHFCTVKFRVREESKMSSQAEAYDESPANDNNDNNSDYFQDALQECFPENSTDNGVDQSKIEHYFNVLTIDHEFEDSTGNKEQSERDQELCYHSESSSCCFDDTYSYPQQSEHNLDSAGVEEISILWQGNLLSSSESELNWEDISQIVGDSDVKTIRSSDFLTSVDLETSHYNDVSETDVFCCEPPQCVISSTSSSHCVGINAFWNLDVSQRDESDFGFDENGEKCSMDGEFQWEIIGTANDGCKTSRSGHCELKETILDEIKLKKINSDEMELKESRFDKEIVFDNSKSQKNFWDINVKEIGTVDMVAKEICPVDIESKKIGLVDIKSQKIGPVNIESKKIELDDMASQETDRVDVEVKEVSPTNVPSKVVDLVDIDSKEVSLVEIALKVIDLDDIESQQIDHDIESEENYIYNIKSKQIDLDYIESRESDMAENENLVNQECISDNLDLPVNQKLEIQLRAYDMDLLENGELEDQLSVVDDIELPENGQLGNQLIADDYIDLPENEQLGNQLIADDYIDLPENEQLGNQLIADDYIELPENGKLENQLRAYDIDLPENGELKNHLSDDDDINLPENEKLGNQLSADDYIDLPENGDLENELSADDDIQLPENGELENQLSADDDIELPENGELKNELSVDDDIDLPENERLGNQLNVENAINLPENEQLGRQLSADDDKDYPENEDLENQLSSDDIDLSENGELKNFLSVDYDIDLSENGRLGNKLSADDYIDLPENGRLGNKLSADDYIELHENGRLGNKLSADDYIDLPENEQLENQLSADDDIDLPENEQLGNKLSADDYIDLPENEQLENQLSVDDYIDLPENGELENQLIADDYIELPENGELDNQLSADDDIDISDNEQLDNQLSADDYIELPENGELKNQLSVDDDTDLPENGELKNELSVDDDTDLFENGDLENQLSVDDDIDLPENGELKNELSVDDDTDLPENGELKNELSVDDDTDLSENGDLENQLSADDDIDFPEKERLGNQLQADVNVDLLAKEILENKSSADDDLYWSESGELKNYLKVDDDIDLPENEGLGNQLSVENAINLPENEQLGNQLSVENAINLPENEQLGNQLSSDDDIDYPENGELENQLSADDDINLPENEQLGNQLSADDDIDLPENGELENQLSADDDIDYPENGELENQLSADDDIDYPENGDLENQQSDDDIDLPENEQLENQLGADDDIDLPEKERLGNQPQADVNVDFLAKEKLESKSSADDDFYWSESGELENQLSADDGINLFENEKLENQLSSDYNINLPENEQLENQLSSDYNINLPENEQLKNQLNADDDIDLPKNEQLESQVRIDANINLHENEQLENQPSVDDEIDLPENEQLVSQINRTDDTDFDEKQKLALPSLESKEILPNWESGLRLLEMNPKFRNPPAMDTERYSTKNADFLSLDIEKVENVGVYSDALNVYCDPSLTSKYAIYVETDMTEDLQPDISSEEEEEAKLRVKTSILSGSLCSIQAKSSLKTLPLDRRDNQLEPAEIMIMSNTVEASLDETAQVKVGGTIQNNVYELEEEKTDKGREAIVDVSLVCKKCEENDNSAKEKQGESTEHFFIEFDGADKESQWSSSSAMPVKETQQLFEYIELSQNDKHLHMFFDVCCFSVHLLDERHISNVPAEYSMPYSSPYQSQLADVPETTVDLVSEVKAVNITRSPSSPGGEYLQLLQCNDKVCSHSGEEPGPYLCFDRDIDCPEDCLLVLGMANVLGVSSDCASQPGRLSDIFDSNFLSHGDHLDSCIKKDERAVGVLQCEGELVSGVSNKRLISSSYSDPDIAIGFFTRHKYPLLDDQSLSLPDVNVMACYDNRSQNSNHLTDTSDMSTCSSVPPLRVCQNLPFCDSNRKVRSEHSIRLFSPVHRLSFSARQMSYISPKFWHEQQSEHEHSLVQIESMSLSGTWCNKRLISSKNSSSTEMKRILKEDEQRRFSSCTFSKHLSHRDICYARKQKSCVTFGDSSELNLSDTSKLVSDHFSSEEGLRNYMGKEFSLKEGNTSRAFKPIRKHVRLPFGESLDILKPCMESEDEVPHVHCSIPHVYCSESACKSSGDNNRQCGKDFDYDDKTSSDSLEHVSDFMSRSADCNPAYSHGASSFTGACFGKEHSKSLPGSPSYRYDRDLAQLSWDVSGDNVSDADDPEHFKKTDQAMFYKSEYQYQRTYLPFSPPKGYVHGHQDKYGKMCENNSETTLESDNSDSYDSTRKSCSISKRQVTFLNENTIIEASSEESETSSSDSFEVGTSEDGSCDYVADYILVSSGQTESNKEVGEIGSHKEKNVEPKIQVINDDEKDNKLKVSSSSNKVIEDNQAGKNYSGIPSSQQLDTSQSLGPWNLNIKVVLEIANENTVSELENETGGKKLSLKSVTQVDQVTEYTASDVGMGNKDQTVELCQNLDLDKSLAKDVEEITNSDQNKGLLNQMCHQEKYLTATSQEMIPEELILPVLEKSTEGTVTGDAIGERPIGCFDENHVCKTSFSETFDDFSKNPSKNVLTSSKIESFTYPENNYFVFEESSDSESSDYVALEMEKITCVVYKTKKEEAKGKKINILRVNQEGIGLCGATSVFTVDTEAFSISEFTPVKSALDAHSKEDTFDKEEVVEEKLVNEALTLASEVFTSDQDSISGLPVIVQNNGQGHSTYGSHTRQNLALDKSPRIHHSLTNVSKGVLFENDKQHIILNRTESNVIKKYSNMIRADGGSCSTSETEDSLSSRPQNIIIESPQSIEADIGRARHQNRLIDLQGPGSQVHRLRFQKLLTNTREAHSHIQGPQKVESADFPGAHELRAKVISPIPEESAFHSIFASSSSKETCALLKKSEERDVSLSQTNSNMSVSYNVISNISNESNDVYTQNLTPIEAVPAKEPETNKIKSQISRPEDNIKFRSESRLSVLKAVLKNRSEFQIPRAQTNLIGSETQMPKAQANLMIGTDTQFTTPKVSALIDFAINTDDLVSEISLPKTVSLIDFGVNTDDFESQISKPKTAAMIDLAMNTDDLDIQIFRPKTSAMIDFAVNTEARKTQNSRQKTASRNTFQFSKSKEDVNSHMSKTKNAVMIDLATNTDNLESQISKPKTAAIIDLAINTDDIESQIFKPKTAAMIDMAINTDDFESHIPRLKTATMNSLAINTDDLEFQLQLSRFKTVALKDIATSTDGLEHQMSKSQIDPTNMKSQDDTFTKPTLHADLLTIPEAHDGPAESYRPDTKANSPVSNKAVISNSTLHAQPLPEAWVETRVCNGDLRPQEVDTMSIFSTYFISNATFAKSCKPDSVENNIIDCHQRQQGAPASTIRPKNTLTCASRPNSQSRNSTGRSGKNVTAKESLSNDSVMPTLKRVSNEHKAIVDTLESKLSLSSNSAAKTKAEDLTTKVSVDKVEGVGTVTLSMGSRDAQGDHLIIRSAAPECNQVAHVFICSKTAKQANIIKDTRAASEPEKNEDRLAKKKEPNHVDACTSCIKNVELENTGQTVSQKQNQRKFSRGSSYYALRPSLTKLDIHSQRTAHKLTDRHECRRQRFKAKGLRSVVKGRWPDKSTGTSPINTHFKDIYERTKFVNTSVNTLERNKEPADNIVNASEKMYCGHTVNSLGRELTASSQVVDSTHISTFKEDQTDLIRLLCKSDICLKEVKLVLLNKNLPQTDSCLFHESQYKTDDLLHSPLSKVKELSRKSSPDNVIKEESKWSKFGSDTLNSFSSFASSVIKSFDFSKPSMEQPKTNKLWTVNENESEAEEDQSFKSACGVTENNKACDSTSRLIPSTSEMNEYHSCSSDPNEYQSQWQSAYSLDESKTNDNFTSQDITQFGNEMSSCESSMPDMTEYDESKLSSDEDVWDADVSSLDSTLGAPYFPDKIKKSQPPKYRHLVPRSRTNSDPPKLVFHVDEVDLDLLVHKTNIQFECTSNYKEDTDSCQADVESLSEQARSTHVTIHSNTGQERYPSFLKIQSSLSQKTAVDHTLDENTRNQERYNSFIVTDQPRNYGMSKDTNANLSENKQLFSPNVGIDREKGNTRRDKECTPRIVQLESVYYTDSTESIQEDEWLAYDTPDSIKSSTDSTESIQEDEWLAYDTPDSIKSSLKENKELQLKLQPRRKLSWTLDSMTESHEEDIDIFGMAKERNNFNNNDTNYDFDLRANDGTDIVCSERVTGTLHSEPIFNWSDIDQSDTNCLEMFCSPSLETTLSFQLPYEDSFSRTGSKCLCDHLVNHTNPDYSTNDVPIEMRYEPFIFKDKNKNGLPVILEESEYELSMSNDSFSNSSVASYISSNESFTNDEWNKPCCPNSSEHLTSPKKLLFEKDTKTSVLKDDMPFKFFPDLFTNDSTWSTEDTTLGMKAHIVDVEDIDFNSQLPNFGFTPEHLGTKNECIQFNSHNGDCTHDTISDTEIHLEIDVQFKSSSPSSESCPAEASRDPKEVNFSLGQNLPVSICKLDLTEEVSVQHKAHDSQHEVSYSIYDTASVVLTDIVPSEYFKTHLGDSEHETCRNDVQHPVSAILTERKSNVGSHHELGDDTCSDEEATALLKRLKQLDCVLQSESDLSLTGQLDQTDTEESFDIKKCNIEVSCTVQLDVDSREGSTNSTLQLSSGHEINICAVWNSNSKELSHSDLLNENNAIELNESLDEKSEAIHEDFSYFTACTPAEDNLNEAFSLDISFYNNEDSVVHYSGDKDQLNKTFILERTSTLPEEPDPSIKEYDQEDDLNASSEAYSDNMERIGSSDEQLDDSGESPSDSDILLHTSSRITDHLVLQRLTNNTSESATNDNGGLPLPVSVSEDQEEKFELTGPSYSKPSFLQQCSHESHLVDELELAAFLSNDCSEIEDAKRFCPDCTDIVTKTNGETVAAENDSIKAKNLSLTDNNCAESDICMCCANKLEEGFLMLSNGLDSSGSTPEWPDCVRCHQDNSHCYYHLYFDKPGSDNDSVNENSSLDVVEGDSLGLDSDKTESNVICESEVIKCHSPPINSVTSDKCDFDSDDTHEISIPTTNICDNKIFLGAQWLACYRLKDEINEGSSQAGLLGQSDLCHGDDLFAVSSLSDPDLPAADVDHEGTSTCNVGFCFSDPKFCHCHTGEKKRYSSFITGSSSNSLLKLKSDHLRENASLCQNWILQNSISEFCEASRPETEMTSAAGFFPSGDFLRNSAPLSEDDHWLGRESCPDEVTDSTVEVGYENDLDELNKCIILAEDSHLMEGDKEEAVRHTFTLPKLILHLNSRDLLQTFGFCHDDLTKLLREIMQEARNLTDAERCSVFLLDKDSDELVAMVFDGITADDKEWQYGDGVQGEIRLPKTQGIAGHVATTGKLLNIRDAYSHPLFYRGIDDSTGFRTRNILCFPIKDEEGVVLGVAQLCNKKTFQYFTTFDEDIASAFAVYCCISISHSLMYKKVIDIQYRNSLANELMMFHMKSLMYKRLMDTQHRHRLANELMIFHINQQVPMEEVKMMAETPILPVTTFSVNFDSFDFAPRMIPESQTVMSCLSMFEDLGFLSRWRIKIDTLVRFLLMVKKGYRNPPYHNWMHAYAVTHFCYLLIKNLHLHNYLDDIELLALFVSCLCHDIDHRGTTNSFQVQSQSVLAALYSSEGSVMERHHLAQSMCILNTEGSNLFENLSSKEYQAVLDLMREIILATDLAHHLRTVKDQEHLAESDSYDRNNHKHKHMLLCLLMTACDLSDQTKNWNNTKHIAALVYQEFFSQGDLEKALGKNPLEMMDRERACIPELQISFLDNIAAPVYKILARMFSEAQIPARNVEENRKHWVHIGQLLKLRHGNSTQAMSLEQIISIEEEVEDFPSNGDIHLNGR